MYPRSICPRYGHPLNPTIVSGGVLGLWVKQCANCGKELSKGMVRHSCPDCKYHICEDCKWTPACRRGHPLAGKVVRGGHLGLGISHALGLHVDKVCSKCGTTLSQGLVRHSCKPCDFHLCEACVRWLTGGGGSARRTATSAEAFGSGFASWSLVPRVACQNGARCCETSMEHINTFAHPGDRSYREGFVIFEGDAKPEFETMWQLFQYHDVDESGQLSQKEFAILMTTLIRIAPQKEIADKTLASFEQAWEAVGGSQHGYVNFSKFATWTQKTVGLDYPIGIDEDASATTDRPCRFKVQHHHGAVCKCPNFRPCDKAGIVCVCGHKTSSHRSDHAQGTLRHFKRRSVKAVTSRPGESWTPGKESLVQVRGIDMLHRLQNLLNCTHKTTDNWTRDRGCTLHGVHGAGCSLSCASKHRNPVPTGYSLLMAFRNQNSNLWQRYCLMKAAMAKELGLSDLPVEEKSVASAGSDLGADLDTEHNEWYLYHGTSVEACVRICSENFQVKLAGTGATWKDAGATVGTPLYGFGIYCAEHFTKADEYAKEIPKDSDLIPEDIDDELYAVLVCRVQGGRTNVITTNEIKVDELRADVFDGPFHSVFGDRMATLRKPYREVVVYDKDQVYPEYMLVYARDYGAGAKDDAFKASASLSGLPSPKRATMAEFLDLSLSSLVEPPKHSSARGKEKGKDKDSEADKHKGKDRDEDKDKVRDKETGGTPEKKESEDDSDEESDASSPPPAVVVGGELHPHSIMLLTRPSTASQPSSGLDGLGRPVKSRDTTEGGYSRSSTVEPEGGTTFDGAGSPKMPVASVESSSKSPRRVSFWSPSVEASKSTESLGSADAIKSRPSKSSLKDGGSRLSVPTAGLDLPVSSHAAAYLSAIGASPSLLISSPGASPRGSPRGEGAATSPPSTEPAAPPPSMDSAATPEVSPPPGPPSEEPESLPPPPASSSTASSDAGTVMEEPISDGFPMASTDGPSSSSPSFEPAPPPPSMDHEPLGRGTTKVFGADESISGLEAVSSSKISRMTTILGPRSSSFLSEAHAPSSDDDDDKGASLLFADVPSAADGGEISPVRGASLVSGGEASEEASLRDSGTSRADNRKDDSVTDDTSAAAALVKAPKSGWEY
eukprot:TRINITY_DN15862_c0_g1_i2.p1 TRINITY_DN15862_c0_g1~~TRINITY_DN15862_c0_g1_i2.p1  ORF type:complete len:1123 (+),score=183.07 TRINITY_DN15862_c0_g1_i2:123-3491(+)